MKKSWRAAPDLAGLPREPVDRLANPLARFLRIETLGGVVLLAAALAALLLSNSPWAHLLARFWETSVGLHFGPVEFSRSLREWINDALMTLFFFLVAVELKRELVLGELSNGRVAALSIAGALGGMIVPATLYLLLLAGEFLGRRTRMARAGLRRRSSTRIQAASAPERFRWHDFR